MSRIISLGVCVALAALIPMTAYGASSERGAITVDGRRFGTELHLPKASGPVPLVVMIPGTSGVDQRQEFYRSHLLRAGVGTLVVDIKTGIFRNRHDRPPADDYIPVVLEAAQRIRKRADVDGERVGIMGWSFGGTVALRLANSDKTHVQVFAAHVGIYGGCTRSSRVSLYNIPILMLMGTADTMVDSNKCFDFQHNHNVPVIFFEGAHHGFDKEGVNRNRRGRIMRWDREAAYKSRDHVVRFFKKHLISQ